MNNNNDQESGYKTTNDAERRKPSEQGNNSPDYWSGLYDQPSQREQPRPSAYNAYEDGQQGQFDQSKQLQQSQPTVYGPSYGQDQYGRTPQPGQPQEQQSASVAAQQQAQYVQSAQPKQPQGPQQPTSGSAQQQARYGQSAQPEQPRFNDPKGPNVGDGRYYQSNAQYYYSMPYWQNPYGGPYAYAQPGPQYYGPQYDPRAVGGKKKGMKAWQKGLLIFAGITLITLLFSLIISSTRNVGPSFVRFGSYVAQLNVEGTIEEYPSTDYLGYYYGYYHDWTLDKIDELMEDHNNKGLLIYVDSPGGTVYASDELYLKLKEYKEESEKPVYVVMGSMAASGAYYISAPADKIFANRNTWTGSIGVTMGTFIDVSDFLSEHGVRSETITSGRNKAMGGYFDPMTEEQKQIFQGLVDEAYDQFTGIVAEGRNLPISSVKDLADGRIYTATQAIEMDLVDEIGDVDDAFADMKETYDLENCTLQEFSYINSSLLGRALGADALRQLVIILQKSRGDIAAVLEMAERMNRMPICYLYEGY